MALSAVLAAGEDASNMHLGTVHMWGKNGVEEMALPSDFPTGHLQWEVLTGWGPFLKHPSSLMHCGGLAGHLLPALHSFLSRQNLKGRWTMLGILASKQGFYWSSVLVLSPVIRPSIVREMEITALPNAK